MKSNQRRRIIRHPKSNRRYGLLLLLLEVARNVTMIRKRSSTPWIFEFCCLGLILGLIERAKETWEREIGRGKKKEVQSHHLPSFLPLSLQSLSLLHCVCEFLVKIQLIGHGHCSEKITKQNLKKLSLF